MSTLDDILEQIRELNFFLKQTLFILCLFTPVYVGVVFFGFIPEHRCFSPGVAELSQRCGWSLEEQLNLTVPEWGGHGESFSSCWRRYEVDWNTTGVSCTDPLGSLVGNRSAAPPGPYQDVWVYNSPGTSPVTEFNPVFEDSWKLDLFQLCVNAGFFISSLSTGYLGDRFGYKLGLLVTVLVSSTSGVLVAFPPSYSWMVIFLLIQGLVIKRGCLTGYILIAEFVGSSYRRAVGKTYQLFFSSLAYALPHWRWLQLSVTLPNFFFLLYYWYLPESPRWLMAQKQNEKAVEVIKCIAKGNKKQLPPVLNILSPAHSNLLYSQNLGSEDEDKLKPSFPDLVRTPQIRKHTFIWMYSWFTSSVLYQGLIMYMGVAAGNLSLDFLYSALVEFPATFILMLTLDRIGCCYPWAAANVLAGSACLLTALVPQTDVLIAETPEAKIQAVIGLIDGGLVLLLSEMKGKTLPVTTEDAENLHRQEKKRKIIYLHVLASEAAPKATSPWLCFAGQHAPLLLSLTATLNINWGSGQLKTKARSPFSHTRKQS
ncbi:LOW QUALITY PROTEIN: solute carrier family 22 member 2-like [Phaethornis superciliosus]